MQRYQLISLGFFIVFNIYGQSDLDMIRYSRNAVGGTSRFMAMGGAMGALGADLSAGSYNPAGLAVYRNGDLNFAGGLRINNNRGDIYNTSTSLASAAFLFSNFGIAGVSKASKDPESRHVFAFTNTQIQNFSNTVRMSGNTNSQSIANEMLYFAQGTAPVNLNNSYEGLAFDTYLIDYDDSTNSYFSFVDLNRTVKQTRDIQTTGRINELNFSYAYTHKDKYYFGASLGFPQLEYSSTTTHTELDELDSMQVFVNSDNSWSSTYTEEPPLVYYDLLGFHSATYEEYFKTTGRGFNIKIGGIYRINDMIRIGGYYHSPTIYRLTDNYMNTMSVAFDLTKNDPSTLTYPENGGNSRYRVITPSRLSLNTAIIINKFAAIGIDYESVNYRNGSLSGADVSDFENVNTFIPLAYKTSHNLRLGTELNFEPFKARVGYHMNGSPFGDVFVGDFVRNTISFGVGYKNANNFYFDVVWAQTFTQENYFLYTAMDTNAQLNHKATSFVVTLGIKFH